MLHEPDTKAGLVEFIQLIVQSGVQQKHQRQKQQKHQGQAVAA